MTRFVHYTTYNSSPSVSDRLFRAFCFDRVYPAALQTSTSRVTGKLGPSTFVGKEREREILISQLPCRVIEARSEPTPVGRSFENHFSTDSRGLRILLRSA